MTGENDNYEYRTAAEMSLDEQIDVSKKALASAIKLSQSDSSDFYNNKIEEISQRLQNLERIKSSLGRRELYDVINPDDMCKEEIKQWVYATVRDNLLLRGLSRKEVLLLLEEYKLKNAYRRYDTRPATETVSWYSR